MKILPFEPANRDESNGGIPILLRPLDAEIFDETSNGAVIKTPFDDICQLTRHPVVKEEWKYHHSNRPIETSRMVVFLFFYNHWMPRYLNGAGQKCRF